MSILTQSEIGKRSGAARARIAKKRKDIVLALHVAGIGTLEIAKRLGVSRRTIWVDLRDCEDERVRVEEIIEDCGIDATDIHIMASRMADMDLADICLNPEAELKSLEFKPIAQWPAIWRQVASIKMRPASTRSSDGVQAGDSKSWDSAGMIVEVIRPDIMKVLELAAKLKAVDALASDRMEVEVRDVTYRWEGDEDPPAAIKSRQRPTHA